MNDLQIFKTLNANIDELYDLIDVKMREGKFDELNAFFAFICRDIYMFNLDTCLAFLTATLPAKSKIPQRDVFFSKMMKRTQEQPDLLKGLE